jgi:YbbR domain-containing protein
VKLLTRLIFQNLIYKVVALLVAAVLWAAVQGSASIEESIDLPIELQGVPESLVVVGQSALEVNLRIKGSRAALRGARRDLKSYPISLEGIEPNMEARFPVTREGLALPRGAEVVARSPSTVLIQTEQVVRKKVPVRADVVGTPPEGYRLVRVDVEPRQVVLAGARSSIRRLREVLTERVDVSDITETTTREAPLAFGGSLVWRAAEDDTPVKVRIELEGPPETPADESAGAAGSTSG